MIRDWPAQETIQSCVFKTGWLGKQEIDVFGRERSVESADEMSFGICKKRIVACMCCFDYMNGLADITVGYLGALLDTKKMYQWILVRTDRGKALCNLISDDLETVPEETAGDCKKAVKNAARQIVDQMISGSDAKRKTGRKVPIWAGKIIAAIIKRVGPRGPEFARYAIDMHLIRNYTYAKLNYPQLLSTLIPKYVHRILQEYDFTP